MKAEQKENLMNEKINPQAEELADLPVTAEQAEQAKGGGDVVPIMQFSLNYAKIEVEYKPQKPDGTLS